MGRQKVFSSAGLSADGSDAAAAVACEEETVDEDVDVVEDVVPQAISEKAIAIKSRTQISLLQRFMFFSPSFLLTGML